MKSPAASRIGASVPSRISVAYRRIDDLKPDPANPRLHSKKQIRQIANSIEVFGFNVPVLVDAELKVIAGPGRLLACRELGWTEVPTLCLDHLTTAQARAFMIADNRLTEIATWDDRLLAQQLKDLSLLGLDFSLEVIGFEICGSHHSRTCPSRLTTPPMPCPNCRWGRRSAKSGTYGFSADIGCCAATRSTPLISRH